MRPDGGRQQGGGQSAPQGGHSQRAKSKRYRYNCQVRSELPIARWNAEVVLGKITEVGRRLPDEKADVAANHGKSS